MDTSAPPEIGELFGGLSTSLFPDDQVPPDGFRRASPPPPSVAPPLATNYTFVQEPPPPMAWPRPEPARAAPQPAEAKPAYQASSNYTPPPVYSFAPTTAAPPEPVRRRRRIDPPAQPTTKLHPKQMQVPEGSQQASLGVTRSMPNLSGSFARPLGPIPGSERAYALAAGGMHLFTLAHTVTASQPPQPLPLPLSNAPVAAQAPAPVPVPAPLAPQPPVAVQLPMRPPSSHHHMPLPSSMRPPSTISPAALSNGAYPLQASFSSPALYTSLHEPDISQVQATISRLDEPTRLSFMNSFYWLSQSAVPPRSPPASSLLAESAPPLPEAHRPPPSPREALPGNDDLLPSSDQQQPPQPQPTVQAQHAPMPLLIYQGPAHTPMEAARRPSLVDSAPVPERKHKRGFSETQTSVMNAHFAAKQAMGGSFTSPEIAAIAAEVGLTETQVRVYFQNRRARTRDKLQRAQNGAPPKARGPRRASSSDLLPGAQDPAMSNNGALNGQVGGVAPPNEKKPRTRRTMGDDSTPPLAMATAVSSTGLVSVVPESLPLGHTVTVASVPPPLSLPTLYVEEPALLYQEKKEPQVEC